MSWRFGPALLLLPLALLTRCVDDANTAQRHNLTALSIGQTRTVEVYATRFDVTDVEEIVTKQRILELPQSVREGLWLYDLDLTGKSGTPRLLDHAMAQIRATPLDTLAPAERNMIRLINMTPDSADLGETSMEQLLDLAPKIGIAAPSVLADAIGIAPEEPFLSDGVVTEAVMAGVIASHPNVEVRRGAINDAHPDGLYTVPYGHIPVTLEDAASDMAALQVRMGLYDEGGRYHPGFVAGTTVAKVLSDDFQMVLRASTNALPFKGVDLTSAEVGSVSSIGRDGGGLFDFSDPEWLRIEGLAEETIINEMTFQILEYPEWVQPGVQPLPAPRGNSQVWQLPPWTLERVVAQASLDAFGDAKYFREYVLGGEALFSVTMDQGWMALDTRGNLGSPPPAQYIWDLLLEAAQVRLHDEGLAEGEANVRFALRDVPVGVTTEQLEAAIRRNLEEDPSGLVTTASALLDQTAGAPDFFYVRPRASVGPDLEGDWLYYVTVDDIPVDEAGAPLRDPARYAKPGFYADPALTEKVSSPYEVDGDSTHEKIRVEVGSRVYCADDDGATYEVIVSSKPSRATLKLAITRLD